MPVEQRDEPLEPLRVVDRARAVRGGEQEAARLDLAGLQHGRALAARGASSWATSTITSPTTTTSPETLSWRRCSAGVAEEQSSRSEAWSARTRLSSSGIARSNERIPASTWATGIRICAAASAPASVELVSP